MNQQICNEVTERILAELDKGVVPWRRPWVRAGLAKSHRSGEPYSALNQLLLGRKGGEWATAHQVKQEGGSVKPGARPGKIVFWSLINKGKKEVQCGDTVKEVDSVIPVLRRYDVFHLGDVEGVAPKHLDEERFPNVVNPIENAEKVWRDYCRREGIAILNDSYRNTALYSPGTDAIELPNAAQFKDVAEYYSTVFHECVHSTGKADRLKRELGRPKGTKKYAQEELVAEMGAAILCSVLGLTTDESLNNSAAYIQEWRDAISKDNQLVIIAAGRAQKAVDYILGTEYYNALEDLEEVEAVA